MQLKPPAAAASHTAEKQDRERAAKSAMAITMTLAAVPAVTQGAATSSSTVSPSGTVIVVCGRALPAEIIPATGRGFFQEVAGESFCQDALRDVKASAPELERSLRLVPDPSNEFDPFAVAVKSFDDATLGFLPRDDARKYQQLVLQINARGREAVCSGRLVGGTSSKPSIGIYLDLEPATRVAKRLGLAYRRGGR